MVYSVESGGEVESVVAVYDYDYSGGYRSGSGIVVEVVLLVIVEAVVAVV